ncbi:hypothetical protein EPO15_00200 [bacterium]|nr:MAG: hypothetical protein EPO15_00200 [bacterium]
MTLLTLALALAQSAAAAAPGSGLQKAARRVRYGGDCPRRVALQDGQSLPVPSLTSQGPRFRFFFFPLSAVGGRGPSEAKAFAPSASAELDPASGAVTCSSRVPLPKAEPATEMGPAGTKEAAGLPIAAFRGREAEFYAAFEAAAAAFFAGQDGPAAREAARNFRPLFESLSEPGLRDYYRALSPEFWDWLARNR